MTPFDPYHKWLGIPPKEQPARPRHLLGISEDENDPEVVREAALRQTAFVRQFSMGEHGEHAERILGELADARDSILSGKVESPTKSAVKPTPSPVETIATPLVKVAGTADRETPHAEPIPKEDPLTFMTEELAAISSKPSTRSGARSEKPVWQQPWATAAGGAIAMLLIIMLFVSGEETKELAKTNDSQAQQQIDELKQRLAAAQKVAVPPPPAGMTKRFITHPLFQDNIDDVILSLSFDDAEVASQDGTMYLKDGSPLGRVVPTNVTSFVSTPTGKGLVFDGFEDMVVVRDFKSHLTQTKEGVTVACLIKITKRGYVLDIGEDGRQLSLNTEHFQYMPGGSYPDTVWKFAEEPQLDKWLMFVGTWDGTKETTYVNGKVYHSRTGRVQGPIGDHSFPPDTGGSTLSIGQQNKGYRRTGRGFGGILDELLFFRRALTATEVKALYDFEKP